MGKITRRGSLALTAALAVVLTGAVSAQAAAGNDPVVSDTTTNTTGTTVAKDVVTRIGGNDRIDTAIAASTAQYPSAKGLTTVASPVQNVIITRWDDFPDALAVAPLADALDAPVLITPSTGDLDERISAEVTRLRASNVIIVGGKGAVSAEAEATLKKLAGSVERIDGVDRYETAVKVAERTIEEYTTSRTKTPVFLTTGYNPANPADGFADALAAGAAAAQANGVVLLTNGSEFDGFKSTAWGDDVQSSFTLDYLFGGTKTVDDKTVPAYDLTEGLYAIGGPAANAIGRGTTGNGSELKKVVGSDRYDTAAKVAGLTRTVDHDGDEATVVAPATPTARQSLPVFPPSTDVFGVASGQNFPDAVVASAFIANQDGPLFLTRTSELPAATLKALADASKLNVGDDVFVFGGTGVVTESVKTAIETAISDAADTTPPTVAELSLANGFITGKTEAGAEVVIKASSTQKGDHNPATTAALVALTDTPAEVVKAGSNGVFSIDLRNVSFASGDAYALGDLYLTVKDSAGNPANVNIEAFSVPTAGGAAYSVANGVTGSASVGSEVVVTFTDDTTPATPAATADVTATFAGSDFTAKVPAGFVATDKVSVKVIGSNGLAVVLTGVLGA